MDFKLTSYLKEPSVRAYMEGGRFVSKDKDVLVVIKTIVSDKGKAVSEDSVSIEGLVENIVQNLFR